MSWWRSASEDGRRMRRRHSVSPIHTTTTKHAPPVAGPQIVVPVHRGRDGGPGRVEGRLLAVRRLVTVVERVAGLPAGA